MKKLLACIVALFAAVAVLDAKQSITAEMLQKHLEAQVSKQASFGKNLVRVLLSVPNQSHVGCSALLDNTGLLTLDTPCTETLADAYLDGYLPTVYVQLGDLGTYSSGENKGKPFEYIGHPRPENFIVQENGFSLFRLPVQTPEVKKAIASLPSLAGLSDANKAALFLRSTPPGLYGGEPDDYAPRYKYSAESVAGFRKFLQVLTQDLKNYAAALGGTGGLHNIDRYVNLCVAFVDREGTAVVSGYDDYDYVSMILREFGGYGNFYLDLTNLGKTSDGNGYFFDGIGTQIVNDESGSFYPPVVVKFDISEKNPVYKVLQKTDGFNKHKTATLWLKDMPSRIGTICHQMKDRKLFK